MVTVKLIDREHKTDINIPNQPFPLFGFMLPSYNNGKWEYKTERFAKEDITETCFPNENYNYDKLSKNGVLLGVYDEGKCIGLAILQHAMLKYMYLYDLKVNADRRGEKIGTLLIEKSKEAALEHGYRGIYTQAQDNNLGACLFYIKNGFVIGGMDTHVYTGTSSEGKSDILFYLDINK